jgi:hypothetical protein
VLKTLAGDLAASFRADETTHGTVLILPYMNIAGLVTPPD